MTTADETSAALAAVDDALERDRADAADPLERELQELALALRADAPRPREEFAAGLEARRAQGFPRRSRAAGSARRLRAATAARGRTGATQPRRSRDPARRLPLPALAAAASLLAALVVGVALLGGGGTTGTSGSGGVAGSTGAGAGRSAEGSGALSDLQTRDGTEDSTAPERPEGGGIAADEPDRKVERRAELTLAAPEERLDRVAERIVAVTERHRGFVLRSSLETGDRGTTGGSFELRIPQSRLRTALSDLAGLATVRARSESGEDVTPAHESAEDRLDAARADRRGLLRRLERADTDREARAIRERLKLVSAEVRRLRDGLRQMRERVNYAAVSVTLDEERAGGATGAALDDGLGLLSGSMNVAIRALGVLLPVALLAAPAALALSVVRRRRREATLG